MRRAIGYCGLCSAEYSSAGKSKRGTISNPPLAEMPGHHLTEDGFGDAPQADRAIAPRDKKTKCEKQDVKVDDFENERKFQSPQESPFSP